MSPAYKIKKKRDIKRYLEGVLNILKGNMPNKKKRGESPPKDRIKKKAERRKNINTNVVFLKNAK